MSENETTNPTLLGEIEQGPSKFDQFLDKNQKNLIIVGIALVLLVAGYIIFQGLQKNKDLSSSADFMNANTAETYQSVADNKAGTPAGGSALIALANEQWSSGSHSEAIQTLKSFLDQYADHAAYPAVLVNLASKLTNTGESSQAKALLDEAIELEDPTFSPVAQYLLSESKALAGDLDGAVAQLEELNSITYTELGGLKSLVEQSLKFTKSPIPEVKQAPAVEVSPNNENE